MLDPRLGRFLRGRPESSMARGRGSASEGAECEIFSAADGLLVLLALLDAAAHGVHVVLS